MWKQYAVIEADFGRASSIDGEASGAGEGNRTLVSSLGSYSSTIELHPRPAPTLRFCQARRNAAVHRRTRQVPAAQQFSYRARRRTRRKAAIQHGCD